MLVFRSWTCSLLIHAVTSNPPMDTQTQLQTHTSPPKKTRNQFYPFPCWHNEKLPHQMHSLESMEKRKTIMLVGLFVKQRRETRKRDIYTYGNTTCAAMLRAGENSLKAGNLTYATNCWYYFYEQLDKLINSPRSIYSHPRDSKKGERSTIANQQ